MQAIKIASYLPKFHRQYIAELVAIRDIWTSHETSKKYLEYETGTFAGDVTKIEPGRYISLIFIGEEGIPFTHLHPYSAAAKALYKHQIGKDFRVEVKRCERPLKQVDLFDDIESGQQISEYDNFKKWRNSCNNEVV